MHCSATKVEKNGQAYDFAMKSNPQMFLRDENGMRLRAMHCSATKVEKNGQAYDFAMKANPQMSFRDENGRRLRARALFCNQG